MALKQTGRKQYKTMQGKAVDMDLLRQRNELTQAVGNARVNARGDELGPGGKIIKKREDVLQSFYEDNPMPVPDDAPVKAKEQEAEAPEPVSEMVDDAPTKKAPARKAGQTKAEAKVEDEWVEDADGNFVKKGD